MLKKNYDVIVKNVHYVIILPGAEIAVLAVDKYLLKDHKVAAQTPMFSAT